MPKKPSQGALSAQLQTTTHWARQIVTFQETLILGVSMVQR